MAYCTASLSGTGSFAGWHAHAAVRVGNPAEQVWNHAKYSDSANFIPDDLADRGRAVRSSMAAQRDQPSLIRSYFHLAGLEL